MGRWVPKDLLGQPDRWDRKGLLEQPGLLARLVRKDPLVHRGQRVIPEQLVRLGLPVQLERRDPKDLPAHKGRRVTLEQLVR